jgi:hypothetical protein
VLLTVSRCQQGLTELARLEDLFLTSFNDAMDKGIPDDAAV